MASTAIQSSERDPSGARLAALELRVAARERDLAALKVELHRLQTRYLDEIGTLYAELSRLETAVAAEEVRLGLRPPPSAFDGVDDDDEDEAEPAAASGSCGNRSAPSSGLKKMFREVARAIHPDLAMNDPARWRRHSLMAEANRAYAERDEDRLRLIMRTWERSPESVIGDDPEAETLRIERRVALLDDRLIQIDGEFADLRASAIARLKRRIDETAAQGWDLFAEMLRQVERDISRARARLVTLQRRSR